MHVSQYCIVSEVIVGSMVSLWWYSVSQSTAEELLRVVVISWVVGVVSSRGKSDKAMFGESVLIGCVSVRIIVEAVEVSRQS